MIKPLIIILLSSLLAINSFGSESPASKPDDSWFNEILLIIIPVYLAYLFGRRQYLIQRDHEQITKRYLENGIDMIIQGIEHALGIYRENYAYSLRILKMFREKQSMGIQMSSADYATDKFQRYKQEMFYTSPFYKLRTLIGDDKNIFHNETQYLFAFVEDVTNFFEYDLCTVIREYVEGDKINADSNMLFNEYMKKIQEYNEKSHKYYSLIAELQNIAWILETNPILYKKMNKFKNRSDIKACIERIEKDFKNKENT